MTDALVDVLVGLFVLAVLAAVGLCVWSLWRVASGVVGWGLAVVGLVFIAGVIGNRARNG